MKKLLKLFLVLAVALPTLIFGEVNNNPVFAKTSGDYSYEVKSDDTVTILNYNGSEKDLVIPETIEGKVVTTIGYGAFAECKSIETLTVPNTVKIIDSYAFSQCTQLKELNIPNSVVSIEKYAFAGCNSISDLVIPNGIKAISYGAFFDCINLENVTIPEGIESIGGMVFGNCKSLRDIEFPSTLTSIGGNAFTNCVSLSSITIPEGVGTLGSGAFSGCLSLANIELPNTLVTVGQSAFQDCINLEIIELPESILGLGYAAFSGCSSLKNINIPSKITAIGNATFSGCSSLEEIVIPDTIKTLGDNVFSGCVNLKTINIPDSVTEIGDSTFSYCSNLASVKLSKNLKTIATSLFRYCDSIETIVIPSGVKTIGSTSFADCLNLKSVTFPDTIGLNSQNSADIGSRIFSNSPKAVAAVIEGSNAHSYMRKNLIPFILIGTGINLDKAELAMKVGNQSTYVAILSPYKIVENNQLTWTSSNPAVATVDENGTVTALSVGETEITAKTSNGLIATSNVTVDDIHVPITDVKLNYSELTVKKSTSANLRATINPSNTTEDKKLTWTSDDSEIITVSSTGALTGRKPGTTNVTVTTSNGISATCKVTVISEITSVSLNLSAITIEEGVEQSLRATINPSDTTSSKELTWKSSNTNVATVDAHGNVTALKKGTATITVTTVNNKKAECRVTVTEAVKEIPITSVALNKTELTLEEEQNETLLATINPGDTTDSKELTWSSSNEEVATVAKGKVTALKAGTTTITVTTVNGKTAECIVTVTRKPAPITSVELNKTELTLEEEQNETLLATINPGDTTDSKELTWSSSNEEVATVAKGKVTALKAGTATITVTTVNGKTAECIVTVTRKPAPIISIELDKTELTLEEGTNELLAAIINPSDTTDSKVLTVTSSNGEVAKVIAIGQIIRVDAVKAGTTTITVTTVNGKTAECIVTVTRKPAPITSVELNKTELTLEEEQNETLLATINPGDTTDSKELTWSSSNEEVATVAKGKVTALKAGTATITVTTVNGKTAECIVTVTRKPAPIISVELDKTELTLEEGTNELLAAIINPSDTTDSKVLTVTSSNGEVAKVIAIGQIIRVDAVKAGTTTITVTTVNGKTAECIVTVTRKPAPITSVELNKTELTLEEEQNETLLATINPGDTTDSKELTWSSSNEEVATVAKGKVTALKAGTATITVTTVNGKTAECIVTVTRKPAPIISVELDKTELTLEEGTNELLAAIINPSDTTDSKVLTVTSSNGEVAKVIVIGQIIRVDAVKAGTATITVTTVNGKTAECIVTVTRKPAPITSVELNKTELTLEEEQNETLLATINPGDTTDSKELTWSSSNEEVATVAKGKVTALKAGTATITVTTVNGKTAECIVTVTTKLNVDKFMLQIAVERANEVTEEELANVVPVVVKEFKAALAEAKEILANEKATQVEVNESWERLSTALQMLQFIKGDKTELEALVDQVKEMNKTDYTVDSWNVVEAALENANTVLANENALQDEVDEAKEILKTAIANLVRAVDKTNLELFVNKVQGLDGSKYTDSSWTAFMDALNNGLDILDSENTTQTEVDNAYTTLVKSYLYLRLKPNKDLLN